MGEGVPRIKGSNDQALLPAHEEKALGQKMGGGSIHSGGAFRKRGGWGGGSVGIYILHGEEVGTLKKRAFMGGGGGGVGGGMEVGRVKKRILRIPVGGGS